MNKWDKRYIEMAYMVAGWSKDPSTGCGAVITDGKRLVSVGFNGFPQNTSDSPELYEDREEKYRRVQHSERNAILFAKRDLDGCTMYVVPMQPCSQCAGMIIQSGIKRVVTVQASGSNKKRWGKDIQSSLNMFKEAKVQVEYIE